jgi:hypothetical protein
VSQLADRYRAPVDIVITRAIELELCHLVCRDKASYRLYLRHPYWASTQSPLGRRLTYMTTHRYCEMLVAGRPCRVIAVAVHHTEAGYEHLGRERDEHLRSLCATHHDVQHPRVNAEQLALDFDAT